jgi:hypothetical protein
LPDTAPPATTTAKADVALAGRRIASASAFRIFVMVGFTGLVVMEEERLLLAASAPLLMGGRSHDDWLSLDTIRESFLT